MGGRMSVIISFMADMKGVAEGEALSHSVFLACELINVGS